MSHVEIEQPTQSNGLVGTVVRQNSDNVGNFVETVVLPKHGNDWSVKTSGQDVEIRIVPEQTNSPVSSQPRRKYPKSFVLSLDDPKAFPFFMILISLTQAMVYATGGNYFWLNLGYDPYRRHEVWRFLTIMFVHNSGTHLAGNLLFQCILGVLLEIVHHWKRVGIIYMVGVLGGTLFITVFTPQQYCVGASAGVYALLSAHVATILLNWNEIDNKWCRAFWLLAYIVYDVGQTLYSEVVLKKDSNISHAGHFGGALTGFLISVLVLKNFEKHPWEKTLQKICAAVLIASAIIIVSINIVYPSMYYPSEFNTDYEETFLVWLIMRILETLQGSESPDPSKSPCLEDTECADTY